MDNVAPPLIEVALHGEAFEPLERLVAWHARLAGLPGGPPAAEAHFLGRVRPVTASGAPLEALELEHYPGMTETQIERLAATLAAGHGLRAAAVHHRVGVVRPGETIVLVATAADRRGPAQRGALALLEALKHEAPFWKREWSRGTGTWVEGNTPL